MSYRRCLVCRKSEEKEKLFRLIAHEQFLKVDRAKTAHGRGAYVHMKKECVIAMCSKQGWAKALRTHTIVESSIARCREELSLLCGR